MQREVVEEDIDRNPVPEKASLTVALDSLHVVGVDPDALRQRFQHPLRVGRVAEDVDVEVSSASRLFDAVGKRNRPTERMRQRPAL